MKVLLISGSSRDGGNTELLAERVLEGLDCTRVYLRHLQIDPITDKRHAPEGFAPLSDDHHQVTLAMLAHDIILFATPLYWYGMSGHMKDFVDRWSQSLRDSRYDFKNQVAGKLAYVVVTGGPDARLKGLPLIQQFAHIFSFVGMEFGGYLIGTGGKPGQVRDDERALLEAGWLNGHLRQKAL